MIVKAENDRDYTAFLDYLSTTVIRITKQMTNLELVLSEKLLFDASQVISFSIKTSGDFRIAIVLCAQREVMQEIAKRMKRQDAVSIGDVEIYGGEYFNILCGSFISYVNKTLQTSTQFYVPQVTKGFFIPKSLNRNHWKSVSFSCPYGALEFFICTLDV